MNHSVCHPQGPTVFFQILCFVPPYSHNQHYSKLILFSKKRNLYCLKIFSQREKTNIIYDSGARIPWIQFQHDWKQIGQSYHSPGIQFLVSCINYIKWIIHRLVRIECIRVCKSTLKSTDIMKMQIVIEVINHYVRGPGVKGLFSKRPGRCGGLPFKSHRKALHRTLLSTSVVSQDWRQRALPSSRELCLPPVYSNARLWLCTAVTRIIWKLRDDTEQRTLDSESRPSTACIHSRALEAGTLVKFLSVS